MSSKDHRSITYIYNEMDPSEEIEFERELELNSDLLIEVESLKQVKNKLHCLEQFDPPKELVEAVCQQAGEKGPQQKGAGRTVFYAVAAIVLIGMTSGVWLADSGFQGTSTGQNTDAQFAAPTLTQPVGGSSSSDIKPWIDENDIIYLGIGEKSSNQAEIDSMMMNSLKKLTPVTNTAQMKSFQNRLHLTGANN